MYRLLQSAIEDLLDAPAVRDGLNTAPDGIGDVAAAGRHLQLMPTDLLDP
jgi:hypothetical protein